MKRQEDFDRSALGWVRKELDQTLDQAAQALQEYSEEPEDRTRLRFCATYLHQVYGTLQMLELYGVSMLNEEMELLIEAMLADRVGDVGEAQEALMTGILRTSELLERIQAGQNDSPLLVLPLVNDLRTARGEKLISEGALFLSDAGSVDGSRRSRDPGADLAKVAKAVRPRYQRVLLALLRGSATSSDIDETLVILDQLDDASTDDKCGDLWWVAGGVVQGLAEETVKPGASVHGLLREVDQQMRLAIRAGEQALIADPPSELFGNLLYYTIQAGSVTERLQAIHERFHLESLVREAGTQAGQSFAPAADIIESVVTAIREDTTGVKDSLDLFVRSGQKDAGRLEEAGASLKRVADTLGMLGLGASRNVARQKIPLVEKLAAGETADEQQLLDLAKSLLYVESSLETLVPGGATIADSAGDDESSAQEPDDDAFLDMEYQSVYRTTVREAVADISAVKEAIIRFMERQDHAALGELGGLTRRLQGALEIINLDRAGALIKDVAAYLQDKVIGPRQVPDSDSMDVLADAITSLEYYLEAVLEDRTGRDAILDVAERSISYLGSLSVPTDSADSTEADTQPDAFEAESVPVQPVAADPVSQADPEPKEPASAPLPLNRTSSGVNHDVVVRAEEIDEEILEIFLEEVDEVLETLRSVYPLWRNDIEDSNSLATLRRMFHTLKGSGRMAGALLMGELGWSVERLLNRVIDGHVEPDAEVLDVIDRTMDAVPELARELQDGTRPGADVRLIMHKADKLADPDRYAELGDDPPASVPVEAETTSVAEAVDDVPPDAEVPGESDEAPEPPGSENDVGFGEEVIAGIPAEREEDAGSRSADQTSSGQAQAAQSPETGMQEPDFPGMQLEELEELSASEELIATGLPEVDSSDSDSDEHLEWFSKNVAAADDHQDLGSGKEPALDQEDAAELDEADLDAMFAELEVPADEEESMPADLTEAEPENAAEPEDAAASETGKAESASEQPLKTAESTDESTDTGPKPLMDAVLYEIFSNETDDHLSVVQEFIEDCRAGNAHGVVSDELARALHTLTGSARMADVKPVSRLGRRLEQFVGQRKEHGKRLNDGDLDLLESGAARINAIVHALGDADRSLPDIEDLVEAVTEREQIQAAPPSDSDNGTDPVPASAPVEDAAGERPVTIPPDVSPAEDDTVEDAVPAVSEQAAPSLSAESADSVASDLVTLFLEEAEDILHFLQASVAGWEDGSGVEARVTELLRSLRTLQGGARLAGLGYVGELCHSLEALISDVEAGRVPSDDRLFDLLHDVMERLADMVARARDGKPQSYSEDLQNAIAAMRAGDADPPEAPEPAVVSQSAAGPVAAAESAQSEPAQDGQGIDVELVEVFLEEATDILQAIESAQHAWADEPDDRNQLIEIERALHTLKGGARMVGFAPIATLSHGVETLLSQVRGGTIAADERLFELLDLTHDRLLLMRERATSALALEEATDLLEQLKALHAGGANRGAVAADPGPRDSVPAEPTAAAPTAGVPGEVAATKPGADDVPGLVNQDQDAHAGSPVGGPLDQKDAEPANQQSDTVVRVQSDQVRVRADLLDNLVNFAGEVSIYRARLDQQVGAFRFNLTELDQTVLRLRDQLRTLEIETETQILYRYEREHGQDEKEGDFDPLELDRFSRMQELSRSLSESVSDLGSIQALLDNLARESETLLLQQSRVNTELQDGLMRTRMVPFANMAPRLRRIVRQTAQELGRKAQVTLQGAQGEMDRTVLERITAPLEHMLRNAVAHGIETEEERLAAGKPDAGQIIVSLDREGADVVLRVRDDGAGMNLEAIRRKARDRGLLRDGVELTDREIMQFVLEQGFSTADAVSQIAGRGVGMDVVNSEIKQLGGILEIDSTPGEGTLFTVRLPFTLAVNQALLCVAGEQVYAIPLTSIVGVVRFTKEELEGYLAQGDKGQYRYGDADYQVLSLLDLLGTGEPDLASLDRRIPVVLVQSSEYRMALQVDSLLGNREIVVKSVGAQISTVPGIFGATILADGRVVLILDVSSLIRLGALGNSQGGHAQLEQDGDAAYLSAAQAGDDTSPVVMVVDDSITMRKVATRLLEKNGMQVITAKDGIDAVAKLQELVPDAMLLDIEMPRMDGYELAAHMRNDERLQEVPIIMITSRTGKKHSQKAMEIGVNRYLGKPYQEDDLLNNLQELLGQDHGGD